MNILIVIVNFNDSFVTLNCIESVNKSKNHVNIDLCIVDNASDKENVQILKNANLINCNIIFSNINLGYFPGLNLGLSHYNLSSYDYVIVGNNDIIFRGNFFNILSEKQYSDKYYCIAPNIIAIDGYHQNPHEVIKIPLMRQFLYKLYFSSFILGNLMFNLQQLIKKIRNRNNRVKNSDNECEIYLGYGALYILTKSFFVNNQLLEYPHFLMGEEVYLSYQVYKTGGFILYDPLLEVSHLEHSSVSKMSSRKMYDITKESFKGYSQLFNKINFKNK
ncbi:glycosyltransferase family 2 protein [Thiospirochaeta perfilievii]|uniref:Glycosyltransferase family 2 protein n=1 Tax=Thiospirochaeta perfilievii TaxID=252967 RepID=A0A5C1QE17_9SPIO|nr:glycosyltransferase [Thiospirochaeta perfilievii]QEN05618.1 glycosyltransferase family 2 protein [Thiospirochaeta perfilievii]